MHVSLEAPCFHLDIREGELMAVTAPTYILEESQSSQSLWKHTAGTRPPQPVEERAFFEQLWAQNFQRSQVEYNMPSDVLTALSPLADGNYDVNSPNNDTDSEYVSRIVRRENHGFYGGGGNRGRNIDSLEPLDPHLTIVNKKVKDVETNDELTIVVRGDNVFGTTVSKSFPKGAGAPQGEVITVSISIASYRVVEVRRIFLCCVESFLEFFRFIINTMRSRRSMVNMLSIWLFFVKEIFVIQLVYGNAIQILKG